MLELTRTYNGIVIECFFWQQFPNGLQIHPHWTKKVDNLNVGKSTLCELIVAQSQLQEQVVQKRILMHFQKLCHKHEMLDSSFYLKIVLSQSISASLKLN